MTITQESVLNDLRELGKTDPEGVYKIYGTLFGIIVGLDFPKVGIRNVFDDDGEVDYAVFIDPYTGGEFTELICEDEATRWNYGEGRANADAEGGTVSMDYDGRGEYETLVYLSGASQRPVSLPEGWTVEAAW